jgi:hypothetical protein
MRRFVIPGLLVILIIAGCTSMKASSTGARPDASQVAAPTGSPPPGTAPPGAAPQSVPSPAAPTNEPTSPSNGGAGQSSTPPPPAGAAPSAASSHAAGAAPRTATAPTRSATAAPRTAAAPPRQAAVPPPTPAPASKPTLNLTDLEQRLRDTHAIGLFAKLSLKNQVDDLLNAFRALYRDPSKRPPPELRQRYDQLLLKVLSLLQDSDPPLATAIASSREAIWSILADPDKFAKI